MHTVKVMYFSIVCIRPKYRDSKTFYSLSSLISTVTKQQTTYIRISQNLSLNPTSLRAVELRVIVLRKYVQHLLLALVSGAPCVQTLCRIKQKRSRRIRGFSISARSNLFLELIALTSHSNMAISHYCFSFSTVN